MTIAIYIGGIALGFLAVVFFCEWFFRRVERTDKKLKPYDETWNAYLRYVTRKK